MCELSKRIRRNSKTEWKIAAGETINDPEINNWTINR